MGSFQKGSLIERLATQAVANSTLTLTQSSLSYQRFTGSTTGQIVKLPDATTLVVGQKYVVINRATVSIAVQDGSAAALATVIAGQDGEYRLVSGGTAAGVWISTVHTVFQSSGQVIQNWTEDGNSPTPALDAVQNRVYNYQTTLAQNLYTVVRVPNSYVPGTQIKMLLAWYANNTNTGNVLMQTVATLIRPGTDTFSTTTNQRTSTNATVVNPTANVLQATTLDLTDATGNINAVAVSAGHLILISLNRATPTGTDILNDVSVMVNGTEVVFS